MSKHNVDSVVDEVECRQGPNTLFHLSGSVLATGGGVDRGVNAALNVSVPTCIPISAMESISRVEKDTMVVRKVFGFLDFQICERLLRTSKAYFVTRSSTRLCFCVTLRHGMDSNKIEQDHEISGSTDDRQTFVARSRLLRQRD